MLVDSGAHTVPLGAQPRLDDGFVSAKWVEERGLRVAPAALTSVLTANGQPASIVGRVQLSVTIGAFADTVSLLVMQHQLDEVDIILGCAWMQRRSAVLDFHEGVVRVWKGGGKAAAPTSLRVQKEKPMDKTQCKGFVPC